MSCIVDVWLWRAQCRHEGTEACPLVKLVQFSTTELSAHQMLRVPREWALSVHQMLKVLPE
eukprot:2429518-Amphidinium_carterae.4